MVCRGCEAWITPCVEREAGVLRCPECGYAEPNRFLPLCILTGASGVGKTAVLPELQCLLPDWDIFETDILWDSGGDWQMVKCNWLRIAHRLAQAGRPVILSGTILPADIATCDTRPFFDGIHFLNLHCDDAIRNARLRDRPAWRGCTEAFLAEQQQLAHWLLANGETAFAPPLTTLDVTQVSLSHLASQIRDWALAIHG